MEAAPRVGTNINVTKTGVDKNIGPIPVLDGFVPKWEHGEQGELIFAQRLRDECREVNERLDMRRGNTYPSHSDQQLS